MRILRLLHTAKEIQVLSLKLLIQQSARYWNKQQIKIQTQGSLTTNHTSVLQLINTMWLYSESQLSNALFSQYFLRSVWELCHVTNSSVELGDNRNRASHTLQSEGAGKARWSPCVSVLPYKLSDSLGDTEEPRMENEERKSRDRSRVRYTSPALSSKYATA